MLDIQLPGTRQGRPNRKYLGVVNADMQEVGAREDEVFDRRRILCGDPWSETPKEVYAD